MHDVIQDKYLVYWYWSLLGHRAETFRLGICAA